MSYDRQGIRNFIDDSVKIGMGVRVWHFSTVLAGCELGIGVNIGSRSEIGFNCKIGAHSRISSGVFLPSGTIVGTRVFIGPNVTCTDDRYPRVPTPEEESDGWSYNAEPPIIEDYAAIGAGAVLLPGVRIGHHALVGAGAVVTKDVPPHAKVYGEAAKLRMVG